jgi:uncharacterized membrane protein
MKDEHFKAAVLWSGLLILGSIALVFMSAAIAAAYTILKLLIS